MARLTAVALMAIALSSCSHYHDEDCHPWHPENEKISGTAMPTFTQSEPVDSLDRDDAS